MQLFSNQMYIERTLFSHFSFFTFINKLFISIHIKMIEYI